jgi:hypothetical protein
MTTPSVQYNTREKEGKDGEVVPVDESMQEYQKSNTQIITMKSFL